MWTAVDVRVSLSSDESSGSTFCAYVEQVWRA